jgi:small subunit ribosomal protein S16
LVVLRLTRVGKKKQAQYRVVVADSKRFVNSKIIENVGWYNPHTKEIGLKKDAILAWLEKGAQPSNTVAKLLVTNGVKLPDWVKVTEKVRKPKKEPVVKAAPVEKPVEEATAEKTETTEEIISPEEIKEEAEVEAEEEIETKAEEAEENIEKNPE